jgi:ABC-type amino acid transport substrate-binding protein
MAKLNQAKKITIGTKFDQPLFGQKGLDGKPVGFDVEIGKAIAAKLGIEPDKIEWVETVSQNRESFIEQGRVDLVIATYRPARAGCVRACSRPARWSASSMTSTAGKSSWTCRKPWRSSSAPAPTPAAAAFAGSCGRRREGSRGRTPVQWASCVAPHRGARGQCPHPCSNGVKDGLERTWRRPQEGSMGWQ